MHGCWCLVTRRWQLSNTLSPEAGGSDQAFCLPYRFPKSSTAPRSFRRERRAPSLCLARQTFCLFCLFLWLGHLFWIFFGKFRSLVWNKRPTAVSTPTPLFCPKQDQQVAPWPKKMYFLPCVFCYQSAKLLNLFPGILVSFKIVIPRTHFLRPKPSSAVWS
jgi:hypothetical protein